MSGNATMRNLSLARLAAGGRCAAVATVAAAFAVACRTGGPAPAGFGPSDEAFAQVVRVNGERGFVILDCLVPPRDGEELAVWRGDERVGWIRVTARRRTPFVAADILAGTLRRGDLARSERTASADLTEVRP